MSFIEWMCKFLVCGYIFFHFCVQMSLHLHHFVRPLSLWRGGPTKFKCLSRRKGLFCFLFNYLENFAPSKAGKKPPEIRVCFGITIYKSDPHIYNDGTRNVLANGSKCWGGSPHLSVSGSMCQHPLLIDEWPHRFVLWHFGIAKLCVFHSIWWCCGQAILSYV